MKASRLCAVVLACGLTAPAAAGQPSAAQAGVPHALTLDEVMKYAVDHYPTVRAALEQVNVSVGGVGVARAAYLPRLDAIWQSNRATANNIFGQLLPQSVIPALSGPVLPSASGQSVWGSAAGALMSWEPIDFGLRRATIADAEAEVARARAGESLTRLEVQSAAGSAFLGVLAAERAVSAARADAVRRDQLAQAVHALVDNQLRPGVEGSRADAERAAARVRLIQAQAALTLARTTMARVLGMTAPVTIDSTKVLESVPGGDVPPAGTGIHPLAQVHQSAIDLARAHEQTLARTDVPRIYVQSSVFARGSGAAASGQLDGGVDGLGLDRANWAAGVQLVVPNVFDFSSLRARKAAAAAAERAEVARYDEAVVTIESGRQSAAALVQAARAIAATTPVQREAAVQDEAQARARYQAGLTSIIEVAEAQNLLAQAEAQDELARVDLWRALLAEAEAQGDLAPFLALVGSSGGR